MESLFFMSNPNGIEEAFNALLALSRARGTDPLQNKRKIPVFWRKCHKNFDRAALRLPQRRHAR